ncbi:MAG TPA: hypothetical protein VK988_02215 [Acidimicrobiales bacterium]|nr:hypothetical protein [Acidimicrobiales bacterium]
MTHIGCTGHQSLSFATRRDVAAAIAAILAAACDEELVGLSSLAEGADQVFAFAVLAAGGQLNAVIPSEYYERSFQSDRPRAIYKWLLRFATNQITLQFPAPSEEAFLAAGYEVVDRCDILLAVWDGQAAAGKGGTADVVSYARAQGIDVRVVWPVDASRG